MITITLLIIAVSFDAMSYGLAQGLKKIKINLPVTILMSFISTILFTIPLYLSKFIYSYFNENLCNIINGIILILIGIIYLVKYVKSLKKQTKTHIINKKIQNINTKTAVIAIFPISIDALFTSFLNGYSLSHHIYGIVLYFIITILSIFILNIIGLKLSKTTKLDLGFLSSIIFIIIGILKIFGI